MQVRTRWSLLAATLFVLAAGCSRLGCGKSPSTTAGGPLLHLRRDAKVLVIPDLGVAGDRLALLEKLKFATFAAQLQGAPNAKALVDAFMQQAGLDLRSRDELNKAGLAPGLGFGAALLPDQGTYFVIGVSDAGRFGDTLKKLARTRLGAGVEEKKTVEGLELVTFSRVAGKPDFAYLMVGHYALAAPGEYASHLPALARLPKEQSLAADPQFQAALGRLPVSRDLILHVPSALLSGSLVPVTAVGSLSAEALKLDVDALWPDSEKTLALFEQKEGGAELLPYLPPDAFLVARFGGDPSALETLLPRITGSSLHRAFTEAKLDLKQEVLGNLLPGSVAALALSPTLQIGAGMPQLDVRRTNPFKFVHLVALAQARAPEKVPPLLARMPEIAPRFGATVEATPKAGGTSYLTQYAQGEGIHFADVAGKVVLASPVGRLEQSMTRLGQAGNASSPPLLSDPELAKVFKDYPVAMVVDLHQLTQSVKSLPSEAWGIGGFAIKATTLRWLEGVGDLRAITFGSNRRDKAVQTEITLRFAKK